MALWFEDVGDGELALFILFIITTITGTLTYAGLVINGGTSTSNSAVISCSTSSCNLFNRLCRCPTNVRGGNALVSVRR